MTELALTLPGTTTKGPQFNISGPVGLKPEFKDLGSLITQALPVVLYITAFLMIFWLAWGIFQYIFAGGNKESLGKARARITWAIVGFLIVVIAFSISQYVKRIFPQVNEFEQKSTIQQLTPP